MEIYIVNQQSGEYEDWQTAIIKAFRSKNEASAYKDRLTALKTKLTDFYEEKAPGKSRQGLSAMTNSEFEHYMSFRNKYFDINDLSYYITSCELI